MPKQLTALSLGAGVQSTALLLLAVEGRIPRPDFAVFADTGWEPKGVYDHLDRLEREVAQPAGIEIVRVRSTGGTGEGIRADALAPNNRYFRLPVFMRFAEEHQDEKGARPMILRRSCTQTYKTDPIFREYRRRLGATISASGRVGPAPKGKTIISQVGISTDELQRARTNVETWIENSYPLLDIGWSRQRCIAYLDDMGWGTTEKSACIGCPFHGNNEWRRLKDTDPESFADAVEFDEAIRNGPPRERTDGSRWGATFYLHGSGQPLADVPFRERTGAQGSLLDLLDDQDWSCSPAGCKTEESEFRGVLYAAGGIDIDNGDDDELA